VCLNPSRVRHIMSIGSIPGALSSFSPDSNAVFVRNKHPPYTLWWEACRTAALARAAQEAFAACSGRLYELGRFGARPHTSGLKCGRAEPPRTQHASTPLPSDSRAGLLRIAAREQRLGWNPNKRSLLSLAFRRAARGREPARRSPAGRADDHGGRICRWRLP
jgi:hypothetical protein